MPSVAKIINKVPKKILILVLVGLLLRLILMPIAFHPDIWAISFAQYLFAFKGVFNIYNYLGDLPKTSLLVQNYGQNFFTYPPLAYFTLGIFGWVLKPLFDANFFHGLAANLPRILSDNRLFWHLFLTKLPYLFFDFGTLFLLVRFFDEPKKKWLVAVLWLFNPLVLYTSYLVGQFDIIPVFFTVLAIFLAKRKLPFWAALALGVGAAFKMFPLFFLPFLAVAEGKNLKRGLALLLFGILPYVLSIVPFVNSAIFRQTVLFSNQSQKMFFAKIPVSGAEYLSLFTLLYSFLFVLSLAKKREVWQWFLAVLLIFFSVTHYHPQWFLWTAPFLVIFMVEYRRLIILPLTLLFCWLFITLLFEPSLSVALFAPISPSLIKLPPLTEVLNHYYDVFQLKSFLRSIFAGVALLIVFLINQPVFVSKDA
jgi:hypothetical protein